MTEEIIGKSAGGEWPVNEYTRNEGDIGKKRIVFIGASYLFVHRVLRDMLIVGGFNNVHIVVHDIDEVPMNIVADLLEKIVRQKKTNIKIFRTLDRKEALKDADAVILSITTGGREADVRSAEVCAKYGIPVGIGDTMGPAAFARNLRTVPVVVEIARDMEKICPNAVLLNFSNPMSCITGAIAGMSNIPVFGLCHSADGLFYYFSKVFGCKKSEVEMKIAGVNHQAFVTKLMIEGKDRTKDILKATRKSDAMFEDHLLAVKKENTNLQQDIYKILGVWPSTGHTHLAEFYEYFFTERRMDDLDLRSHTFKITPGRKLIGRKPCPEIIHEWAYEPEPVGDLHLLTDEHAHELLWAWFTGEPFTRSLNVLNTEEYIKGIPKNACVEIMATVSGRKIRAEQIELPPVVLSRVHRWTAIHDLSIKAAIECDRDAARQALFLDAHVRDMYDIDPMLDDFIKVLDEWMPAGWKK